MFDIDEDVWRRLTELDELMAPLRAEAAEILECTRPGFRQFTAWTFADMYIDRAIGPEAFEARRRERAAETRRRNLEAKRLAEPPAPKPKKRGYVAPYGRRKSAKVG